MEEEYPGLNPLHCGAVVASPLGGPAPGRGVAGLNPLHCGAVVASQTLVDALKRALPVSIPFIAGQWSLRGSASGGGAARAKSQSPSLRGSGRFTERWSTRSGAGSSLNPLHCGAVVASRRCGGPGLPGSQVSIPFIAGQWSLQLGIRLEEGLRLESQSPSLRGSGRFMHSKCTIESRGGKVSIPFIAGQWSLPEAELVSDTPLTPSLNPLHCGAVVASGTRQPGSGRPR